MAEKGGLRGPAQAFGAQLVRNVMEFDGNPGAGEAGSGHDLFLVTGSVVVRIICVCTENLAVSNGATVEVGIAGNTAVIIAQTTASAIDAGEIWHDASPDAEIEALGVWAQYIIAGGTDIIMTVANAHITDGTLVFSCFWTPLVDGSTVIAGG